MRRARTCVTRWTPPPAKAVDPITSTRWVWSDWRKLEDRGGSLFATAIDPDGNNVQIIQLSDEDRAAMA